MFWQGGWKCGPSVPITTFAIGRALTYFSNPTNFKRLLLEQTNSFKYTGKKKTILYFGSRRNIGSFTEPIKDDDELYKPGQAFIHSQFGYRGIVVGGWTAQIGCQVPTAAIRGRRMTGKQPPVQSARNPAGSMALYEVICNREDVEADKTSKLQAATNAWCPSLGQMVTGIDIVQHSDIIPYIPDSPNQFYSYPFPLQPHETQMHTILHNDEKNRNTAGLFEELFTHRVNPMVLPAIQHSSFGYWWNKVSLECYKAADVAVSSCETSGIEITIIPVKMHTFVKANTKLPECYCKKGVKNFSIPAPGVPTSQPHQDKPPAAHNFKRHVSSLKPANKDCKLELQKDFLPPSPVSSLAIPAFSAQDSTLQESANNLWYWAVQTRITLKGTRYVQLLRHRTTTRDDLGRSNTTRVSTNHISFLTPESPSIQYTTICSMATPNGRLLGEFELKLEGDTEITISTAPETLLMA